MVDGHRRIIGDPPLIEPIDQIFQTVERDVLFEFLRTVVRRYRSTLQSDRRHLLEEFRVIDAARKVVGVGSVGTRAWIMLLLGRDEADLGGGERLCISLQSNELSRARGGPHCLTHPLVRDA